MGEILFCAKKSFVKLSNFLTSFNEQRERLIKTNSKI